MQENGIGGLTLPLQLFGENRAPDRHLSRSVFCNDSLAIDDSHDALLVEMPARSSGDRGQIGGPDLETCRDRPISLAGHSVAGSAVSQVERLAGRNPLPMLTASESRHIEERQHEHPEVGARGQLCYPRATGQTKSFGFTVSKAQSIRSINLSAVLPMSSPGIPPRDTVPMTTSPGRRRAKLSRTA